MGESKAEVKMAFTDEQLKNWQYGLKNVWTLKIDREEVEGMIARLAAAEKYIQETHGMALESPIALEARNAWLRSKGDWDEKIK